MRIFLGLCIVVLVYILAGFIGISANAREQDFANGMILWGIFMGLATALPDGPIAKKMRLALMIPAFLLLGFCTIGILRNA
ncbi:MAG: hypothetical protein AABY88_01310 [Pseudomonadota bacterium]